MVDSNDTANAQGRAALAARVARMRVPLGFFCAGAVLWLARPTPPSLAVGGAIAVVGEAMRLWAAGHLDKGREVTQSGPYRFTRHPLYLGSAIVAAGVAVASAHMTVAVLVAIYLAIAVGSAVRHEEENMRVRFGREYEAYLQQTVSPVTRRFSFERAMKVNKEYEAIVGLIAAGLILAAKVALK
jgi:protein-S-isoprenylcysteine O-methyltransferase Ste14